MRADQATNGLTIGEEDQGGHTPDAHLHRRLQVLVGIHAGETQLAGVGLAQFLEDGGQRPAASSTTVSTDSRQLDSRYSSE